jgi:DNA-binding transcriptional LysR family regulator
LRCGLGIRRLPDFLARNGVASGALVRLFPDTEGDRFDIHALCTGHRGLSAKVRVFIDALVEHVASWHGSEFSDDVSRPTRA